ncbi:unnamed protein product [Symbiodinium sp. CCMP2592]|nr:unnamed protein product [Symbiodinium sp. CCMP2592]
MTPNPLKKPLTTASKRTNLLQATGQVDAALAPLRDAEGELKPCLPRHWRFKGKLTWERINAIYSSLEEIEPAMLHYMMAQRMAQAQMATGPVHTVETTSQTVLPTSLAYGMSTKASPKGAPGAESKMQDEPEFLKAMMRDLIFEEPEQNSPRYAPPVADMNVCPMWVTQTDMATLPAVSHVGEYFA